MGNAYRELSSKSILEDLKKLATQWSEKNVNDLGIPEVKEGTVIMCEGVEATGFNWVKVEYIRGNFRVEKELYKKVKPDQWCFGWEKLTADEKNGHYKPQGTMVRSLRSNSTPKRHKKRLL